MSSPSSTTESPSFHSVSEKTGSSKSATSFGQIQEEDLTKDNAASPVDLECLIQAERITKLLDEAIYKTKLSICLPRMVHEFNTLRSVLAPHHLNDLIFIFEQYDNPLFSASLQNMAAMEDIKCGDNSMKNRLNPELGHLLYIVNSYPQLRVTVEDIMNETIPPQPWLEYLQVLVQFRELMLRQMSSTASDQLAAKFKTRKVEESNAKLIADIKDCTATLKEESDRFEEMMALKAEVIAKFQHELLVIKYEVGIKLKKKILDSDRQMVLATRAHDVKYEMLKDEEIESIEAYENVLRRHLVDEKNQRSRRRKVETQLMSWLQKYDAEMSEKQVELNEFSDKYQDEYQKVEDLEIKLEEQNKEFIPLMEEREAEYHQEMTAKMNKFIIEHAVKVIQYSWREVLANRLEKKKLKKLQKKMIEAAEKAAAAAAKVAAAAAKAAAQAAAAAKKAAKK